MPTSITSSGITFDDATTQTTSATKAGGIGTTQLANASVTPAKLSQPYTLDTAKASTSGTSIDFTGIPSWAKRITVMFNGVSTNGTSVMIVQIGSGSFTTSGYSATGWGSAGVGVGNSGYSTGFPTTDSNDFASDARSGIATLVTLGSNIWAFNSSVRRDSGKIGCGVGSLTLSGTLDRIRITTVNGTDTFDAGTINIAYEG